MVLAALLVVGAATGTLLIAAGDRGLVRAEGSPRPGGTAADASLPSGAPAAPVADFIDRPWERIDLTIGASVEIPVGSSATVLPFDVPGGSSVSATLHFVGDGDLRSSDHGVLVEEIPERDDEGGLIAYDLRAGAEGSVTGGGATLEDYTEVRSRWGPAARFRGTNVGADTTLLGYIVKTDHGAVILAVAIPTDQVAVGGMALERMVSTLVVTPG